MKLTFWGAARTTTGSLHLLEVGGRRIALDCGMFQGKRADTYLRNRDFPCDPSSIDEVLLSHAHIDHCGNLPNLVNKGFGGQVWCTSPTHDLASILLMDSAHIQEKDVAFLNKKRRRAGESKEPVEPLYTVDDALNCLDVLRPHPIHKPASVVPGVTARFIHAGHLLGAAQIELHLEEGSRSHRLHFSGDLGRERAAILPLAEIPRDIDTLLIESTYGNRMHERETDLKLGLLSLVKRVADRRGKVIIPSFSVGRTQEVVYRLNELFEEGLLPRIPIYVDSPLSSNATEIFRKHPAFFNQEARTLLKKDDDLFGFGTLKYTRSVEESMALNETHEPMVIISASGMCETGRIVHHLRNSISHPRNCILIVGFQAEHTLGRRIVDGNDRVRIFGEEHPVRAEVVKMEGFSAHADREELEHYMAEVKARSNGRLRRVFLVHGELPAQEELAAWVREHLDIECHIPERGQSVEL